jgi:uncharacterized damage-inducible protein DinB
MERIDRMKRLFEYDDWANREALAALSTGVVPPALAVLAHVLGAERLWLDRLHGRMSAHAVWPDLLPEHCLDEIVSLESAWEDWLDDLDAEDLERPVAYVNSKGERWTSATADVLNHVLLHSAYHRGQIAMLLRQVGHEPPYTDFIHCVRQGFVE